MKTACDLIWTKKNKSFWARLLPQGTIICKNIHLAKALKQLRLIDPTNFKLKNSGTALMAQP